MAVYRLSKAAEIKLAEIYEYSIVNFGEARADAYLISLQDTFQVLADTPRMGRQFHQRRRHDHAEHVIFYRIIDGGIFISQIFHHSENIIAKLR